MNKGVGISLIVVFCLVLIVVAFVVRPTGSATLTPGVNYGPIYDNSEVYHSCEYITQDDGWDVTVTTRVRYMDRLKGQVVEREDSCDTDTKVREYHCVKSYGESYLNQRVAICASGTVCVEGSCVAS